MTPLGGYLRLLSEAFQSDLLNCLLEAIHPMTHAATVSVRFAERVEVDRFVGSVGARVSRVGDETVVMAKLGRSGVSAACSFLMSAFRRSKRAFLPVRENEWNEKQMQVEVSFMDGNGEQMTRVQTLKLPLTENRDMFLRGVDGFVTGVLVAKDVCGSVGMVGMVD